MSRWGIAWVLLSCAGLLGCGTRSTTPASAVANYPQRTVTIVCPWSPGGGTDRVARHWAEALQKEFGQPFVVVNRTGGAGAVGHFAGASAKPDGYTIAMITFELSTMHRMGISRLTYEDYECLLQVNADPAAIMVRAESPWQTLGDLHDEIRSRPGELRMSGTATGGAWDLARAGLLQAAGLPIDSVVWVPHPGAAPSLLELMGGHLDAICCSVPEAASQIKGGQVRVLAVLAAERMADYPDLPTAREQGVDWVAVGWRGLALPKGTPPELVQLLAERCQRIGDSAAYREFMQQNGYGITMRATNEFTDFLLAQDQQWKSVVEAAGYDRGLTGNNDPGPHALPWALAFGLLVLVSWEAWREVRSAPSPPNELPADQRDDLQASHFKKFWLVVFGLAVYVVAISWLGFALSTLIFVTFTTRRLGAQWWAAVLAAVLIVVVVWLLFVQAFAIQLPAGKLDLPSFEFRSLLAHWKAPS